MKKIILLSIALVMVSFSLCYSDTKLFTKKGNTIISPDGIKYVLIAYEGSVTTFGSETFLGRIKGEKFSFTHLSHRIYTGMYSCENDPELTVLVRNVPDSEWKAYYRKASLPKLDLSPENCIRFELVKDGPWPQNVMHMTCNDGIVKPNDLNAFLAEVRSQKSPAEACLYDLVEKSDGTLENCHILCAYGYFEDEPNLAIPLYVTSYNDKAYSININEKEYVLPQKWLTALSQKNYS